MNRVFKKVTTISALAMALFAWGCENIGGVTQPTPGPGQEVYSSADGSRFVVAQERDPSVGAVTAIVGQAGGKLVLGKHELWIPQNAVSGPTTFTMAKTDANNLRVRLTATQLSLNDIGSNGFTVPVTLVMSYGNAANLPPNPSNAKVVYFRPDGLVDPLATQVDVTGMRASASLSHFSQYGLAWP